MEHDQAHEALVKAAFLGELGNAGPGADTLAGCATCRRKLAELRAMTGELDGAADEERAALVPNAGTEGDGDHAFAHAALQRIAAEEPYGSARPRGRPRLGWWTLAAVAAALLAFVALQVGRDDPRRAPERTLFLGDDDGPVPLEPIGEGAGAAVFRWSYDDDRGYGYRVRIYAADAPEDAAPVLRVEETNDEWTPTDEQRALLPSRILWAVDALDASGEVSRSSSEVQASLSSSPP